MPNGYSIESIIVNGLFTLGGVLLGSLMSTIRDLLALKSNQKIEYIWLEHKNRVEAYKDLSKFVRNLEQTIWPDNEEVFESFIEVCKNSLDGITASFPYYSRKVIRDLIMIESLYDKAMIDVNWEIGPEESVKKELPRIVENLYKRVLDDCQKWNR